MTHPSILAAEFPPPPQHSLDYSLTGTNARLAIEKGLAEAEWYQSPVPREILRSLLERRDGPAIRDTVLWFAMILGAGSATWMLWGRWWAVFPYLIYAVLYASTSDSRWHESGHGTAFKTDWMNNALYEVASWMVMRESTVWRWSHARHHSDTIVVGRDPEIAVPRPPDIVGIIFSLFNLSVYPKYWKHTIIHAIGRMTATEKTFIPESEFTKVYFKARISLAIYLGVVALALATGSILPLLFFGLANLFGSWLMVLYGLTQHTGLAENVLDHRLNTRTVLMNLVNRYLDWNMNFHLEHHMFPLVPYHALPQLHACVKADCPPPCPGLLAAYQEIIPTLVRQMKDPTHCLTRQIPQAKVCMAEGHVSAKFVSTAGPDAYAWIDVCASEDLGLADVIRFDHGLKTYALYRDEAGKLFATDGLCTHGNTHLSGGFVKGSTIECPKHNGRFHLVDGSPARPPVCRALATYRVEERQGRLVFHLG